MSRASKSKLLVIGPLPPPYAGPEIGTSMIVESVELNARFTLKSINTTVRKSNRDKGKFDLVMVWAFLRFKLLLLAALISFRPDYVLYCPTAANMKGWVRDGTTIFLCMLFRRRLIMQFRGGHFGFFYKRLGRYSKALIKWLLGRCDLMLVQAGVLKNQFLGLVTPDRLGILPNSIPDEFIDYFEKVDRVRAGKSVRVLFVGHLSFAKGYCDLLKVIPRLTDGQDVSFDFIGVKKNVERNVFVNQLTGEKLDFEDPDECFSEYIEKNGLEGSIRFHGDNVHGQDKLKLFEAADIFVLPSYSEGFSRAILEGMSAGLAVVATRVGAAPEVIEHGENGCLVDPGDGQGLYESLHSLIEDGGLRQRLGANARNKCRAEFLDVAVGKRLAQLIEGN